MQIRRIIWSVVLASLFGCGYQVRMMPRDGGTLYLGEASGLGNGSVSVIIDGKTFSGTWVTVADSGNLTLLNTYGRNSRGTTYSGFGTAQSSSTRGTGVALLSAPDNSGLRC